MYTELTEINRVTGTGHMYVLVSFWRSQAWHDAGNPADLVNDFVMQLRRTVVRVVTNGDGWWQRDSDGVFVDPATVEPGDTTAWRRETVTKTRADLLGEIRANVRAYVREAVARDYRGDHTADAAKPFFVGGKRVAQRATALFVREDTGDADGVLALLRALRGRREDLE